MLNCTSAYNSYLICFITLALSPPEDITMLAKNTCLYFSMQQSHSEPMCLSFSLPRGSLEDGLASFALCVSLRPLELYHLLGDGWFLAQGRLLLPPFAPGLHPRYQTEQGSSEDWGDACQVEGHVVAAQSVPQETWERKKQGRYYESNSSGSKDQERRLLLEVAGRQSQKDNTDLVGNLWESAINRVTDLMA